MTDLTLRATASRLEIHTATLPHKRTEGTPYKSLRSDRGRDDVVDALVAETCAIPFPLRVRWHPARKSCHEDEVAPDGANRARLRKPSPRHV